MLYRKLFIVALGVILSLFLAYHAIVLYSEMGSDKNRVVRDFPLELSAGELVNSFKVNETQANQLYVEKVLKVTGQIAEISFLNDRYTLILQGSDSTSFVLCDMQDGQLSQLKELKEGQGVKIKGVCKGFLVDAIVLNGILIRQDHE
jgi:hypothetical protein